MIDHCPGCALPIRVVPSVYGTFLTLNLEPSEKGSVRVEEGKARVLGNGQAKEARERGEKLFSIHPRSCRKSAEARG